jgi:capsular exopolysaccharide synthesis family protein
MWLMLAVVLLATGAGVLATRFVTPLYEVRASIMIASDSPMENRSGPIRSAGLLTSDDWTQLLKSFTITDAVVRTLVLYLTPDDARDAELFVGFGLADRFVPGKYELLVDQPRHRWTLLFASTGVRADSGSTVDPVGRKLGFIWTLPYAAFNGSNTRSVKFTVVTPREVAVRLGSRLVTQRRQESNFLLLTLQDSDSRLAATILNTWVREYVSVAASLKKRKLTDYAITLQEQLRTSKASLDAAEMQLSSFRVNTITQPSEGGAIAAGVQETRDPVIRSYFDKKIEYDDIKHDVRLLQRLMAGAADSVSSEALLQVRSVASSTPAAEALRNALTEYRTAQSNLAVARIGYTDQHPIVKDLTAQVNALRRERIPQHAAALLAGLRTRESDDSVRISAASENLQRIPQRTIEEERLRRTRDLASGLYANLENRYAEAKLAEASASPDVAVLDSAIAPLVPTTNTAPRLMLMAIIGGIGAAVGLAILLDRIDTRLRYPAQVGDELGLPIAGTVPRFPKGGVDGRSPEQIYQLVESFRSIRMSAISANANGRPSFAVTSPSPGEGKSLIAANLATSFAEAGFRTVLVDGDTRRGSLHRAFNLEGSPGLTEVLEGSADLTRAVQPTAMTSLSLLPCGARKRLSPELLVASRLPALVADLGRMFDVTIFDTPPLAAGIDGYAIAAATGSVLMVLRVGRTKRRMAAEKLRLFERLPVTVIGAVVNGIQLGSEFAYYGYVPGYDARDEPDATAPVRVS